MKRSFLSFAFLASLSFFAFGCSGLCGANSPFVDVPPPSPLPPMPANDPDGLATPEGKACVNLRAISCSDGLPASNGATCFHTMMEVKAEGISIPTDCLTSATSTDIAKSCGVTGQLKLRCP